MKIKQKLLVCALIFLGGCVLNLFFSTALHGLLSHTSPRLIFQPVGYCLKSLVTNKQHFLLFLCIQGFFLILAVLFFTTNLYPYQSDLEEITPDIQTPRAVGQYQHGSAQWLTDTEKDRAFHSFILDPHDKFVKSLIDSGYEDIDFLKHQKEDE